MLTSTVTLLAVSTPSNAQQIGDVNAKMDLFLSVRPNTIGLGQELLINMWASPAPGANRQYSGYELIITRPDGSKIEYTLDSYVADGTMWMPCVVDQVGEWRFNVAYPGDYFPAGRYLDGKLIDGSTGGTLYSQSVSVPATSAKEVVVTVQEAIIPSWSESPLPTDYWTRPVNEENREWWPVLGDYP